MNELKMLNREEAAHLLGTTVYTVDKLRDTAVLLPIKKISSSKKAECHNRPRLFKLLIS